VHHLLGYPAILTHLPPASRQEPFSHCQRPFGLKTTTRSCHTTSHPVGHSIQRHPERSFINTVWIYKTVLILLKSCCVKTTVDIKTATLK